MTTLLKNRPKIDPDGGPREVPGGVWGGPGGSRGMVETLFEKRMEIYKNRFLLIPGAAGGPSWDPKID